MADLKQHNLDSKETNDFWQQRISEDKPRENDSRSAYARDRGRILHSAAFRCLQAKTQIHAVGENDFYRTRLTHSLEVAQIGSSISTQLQLVERFVPLAKQLTQSPSDLQPQLICLLPSSDLIESLCFAHDIGHPPFGHGGEIALNHMMHKEGGFEGNAQTFRLLTKLEPYTEKFGMNLCRRTLLGVIKYPCMLDQSSPDYSQLNLSANQPGYIKINDWRPGKGLYRDDWSQFEWVMAPLSEHDRQLFTQFQQERTSAKDYLKTQFKSLDCSIMELADDIAYGVHDLEDAIVARVVTRAHWEQGMQEFGANQISWFKENGEKLIDDLFSELHHRRKNAIGGLVNYFVTHINWCIKGDFDEPLLRYNAALTEEAAAVLKIFKDFVYRYVIQDIETKRVEYKGQRILLEMFQILNSDPARLLPRNTAYKWENTPKEQQKRVICDYIAGMSDAYALKLYNQL